MAQTEASSETGLGGYVTVDSSRVDIYVELSLAFAERESVCFYALAKAGSLSVLVTREGSSPH